jgi:hypothetical protein
LFASSFGCTKIHFKIPQKIKQKIVLGTTLREFLCLGADQNVREFRNSDDLMNVPSCTSVAQCLVVVASYSYS